MFRFVAGSQKVMRTHADPTGSISASMCCCSIPSSGVFAIATAFRAALLLAHGRTDLAQVREVINPNTFVSLALQMVSTHSCPSTMAGVDFIFIENAMALSGKFNSQGLLDYRQKVSGSKDVWIAFPIGMVPYLVPHAKMFEMAETQGKTRTDLQMKACIYSIGRPSREIWPPALLTVFQQLRGS